MAVTTDDIAATVAAEQQERPPATDTTTGWSFDKNGRGWVRAIGRSGVIWRDKDNPDETVEQAKQRDAERMAREAADPSSAKRKRDPRPRSKAGPPPKAQPTKAELTQFLAELLSMPAVPAYALLDCRYCATHFAEQGPVTAAQLVELSDKHPALRRLLNKWYAAYGTMTYAGVFASYLAKPLVHHVAPQPVFEAMQPVFNMPDRDPKHPNVFPIDHIRKRPSKRNPRARKAPNATAPTPDSTNGTSGTTDPS